MKIKILHVVAYLLGVLIHVEGMPYGRPKRSSGGVNGGVTYASSAE